MISETLLEATEMKTTASYVVVIEKDSMFAALCAQEIWKVQF